MGALLALSLLAHELWAAGRRRSSGLEQGMLAGGSTKTRAKEVGNRVGLSSISGHRDRGKEAEEKAKKRKRGSDKAGGKRQV